MASHDRGRSATTGDRSAACGPGHAREGVEYGRLVDYFLRLQTLNEGFAGSIICLGLCMHALEGTSCDLLEHAIVQKGNRGASRWISISHLSMLAHRYRCILLTLLYILARHATPLCRCRPALEREGASSAARISCHVATRNILPSTVACIALWHIACPHYALRLHQASRIRGVRSCLKRSVALSGQSASKSRAVCARSRQDAFPMEIQVSSLLRDCGLEL